MRVSTNMIFSSGVTAINRQTETLLHVQQQIAAGRRVLTPSDDPVAAARALEVTQSENVVSQFQLNHDNANSSLGIEEAQLSSASDLIARVRELTVQAGNTLLSNSDRRALAFEMRARFDELTGIANATDGAGLYMFSGFMGSTKPFEGTVDFLNAAPGNEIDYNGDEGQRRLQISASRFIEISDSGNNIFRNVREGNGTFVTNYAGANTGTGIIDGGSVISPATWNALPNKDFRIDFTVDNSVVPARTYYDIVDVTSGNSLISGLAAGATPLPPGGPPAQRLYTPGQPIALKADTAAGENPFDLGIKVLIAGDPATNDSFSITPAAAKSIFKTMATLIQTLETSTTEDPAATAKLANEIGFALTNLDQGTENLLRVRAAVGTRMKEIESIGSVIEDLKLQYQQTLSQLQDLDYAKAITDLTRKQTDLQAAQQSFVRISELNLFNYLR